MRGRGKELGKDEGWSFEEAARRIPEFFYPCCCPRVKNADEKQRLADWTETSCGSAREVPAFRFSRRRMRKMFPVSPPAMLRLRKGDLLEVGRELGVEVNGDQTKVEIKDMILQSDKNDMETIKAVMEGILEEKER
ncbi:hypothetical protein TNCV_1244611 [Trichonephila clavipes]|nr:hypothetical protein TNCV_1244611 [Trichonephila clavipes]